MILAEETPNIVANATVAVAQNSSNATAQALAVQQEMLDMLYLLMVPFIFLMVITILSFAIMDFLDDDDSSYHCGASSNQESQQRQHHDESMDRTVEIKVEVADTSDSKGDDISHEEEPRSRWDSLEI